MAIFLRLFPDEYKARVSVEAIAGSRHAYKCQPVVSTIEHASFLKRREEVVIQEAADCFH
jgi:hypothetical protein